MNQTMFDMLAFADAHLNEIVDARRTPGHSESEILDAVVVLAARGYVTRYYQDDGFMISINPAGIDALLSAREQREHESRQAAQKVADQHAADQRESKKKRAEWVRFWLGLACSSDGFSARSRLSICGRRCAASSK